jgi:3-oxoadipate enol-lactonase
VLLHGLGESASSWTPVIAPLAQHHRVLALDLRGHGDSDWPGRYSFRLMRDDVVAFLDQLGPAILIGHSMGGGVAYIVASERPQLVRRLIIEDAPPSFRRDLVIPERPAEPTDFDWAVITPILTEVSQGSQVPWDSLPAITAPTLLIGGGPDSHIPQDKLAEAATRIPRCDLVTIPAGHHIHATRPAEFASTVLNWLDS